MGCLPTLKPQQMRIILAKVAIATTTWLQDIQNFSLYGHNFSHTEKCTIYKNKKPKHLKMYHKHLWDRYYLRFCLNVLIHNIYNWVKYRKPQYNQKISKPSKDCLKVLKKMADDAWMCAWGWWKYINSSK